MAICGHLEHHMSLKVVVSCIGLLSVVEVVGLTDARGVKREQRVAQNVPKKSKGRMIFSLKNCSSFQSVAARFSFLAGRAKPLVLSEGSDAQNGLTTRQGSHRPQKT